MGQQVTLGGERLGTGNKNKIWLHNYERSTHNLSERFTSTLGCGMLIPCLVKPALRGDVFDININAACRTLPTKSPLFSTFKLQVDIFQAPVRLYQGILHNNPLFIGLKMAEVKFPQIQIESKKGGHAWKNMKFADNSLMKYLGVSGLGSNTTATGIAVMKRDFNAIPILAYYDIFKNYYANKQEDNAYLIKCSSLQENTFYLIEEAEIAPPESDDYHASEQEGQVYPDKNVPITTRYLFLPNEVEGNIETGNWTAYLKFHCDGGRVTRDWILDNTYITICSYRNTMTGAPWDNIETKYMSLRSAASSHILECGISPIQNKVCNVEINWKVTENTNVWFAYCWSDIRGKYQNVIDLQTFELNAIDRMRMNLLSHHTLGVPYYIEKNTAEYPYLALVEKDSDGFTFNKSDLQGIVLKTYQADMFNAWVNTDWLDGENGIAEMSKIAVEDGAIYIDAMLLAEKTYKMLNRIAVAGGTYEAWQDVVYTESKRMHIESPIFCGGISNEIVFEEIIQTTPTEGAPLGTLGGRGIAVKRKGGHVSIKVDEASFIMGIVSITPRIYYTQGNEFYMTELKSMDDLHKPAMDGIGFEDLLGERMCWQDTKINGSGEVTSRTKVGKLPAWINYMTSVDKAYGEFCDVNKQGSMILNRQYEVEEDGEVTDFTTYIDPAKYNYAFGDKSLTAQNFWVQIDFDIKARRLMSAKQMPNL